MVVQTQDRLPGRHGMGLYIGAVNVQEYFSRDMQVIELELEHLRIACTLEPSFWEDRPEIHDARLSSWLESKRTSGKLASPPAPVAMIPCGNHSFRLHLMREGDSDSSVVRKRAAGDAAPVVGSLVSEPRTKSRERRVDRLKGDESTSPAANN
jgi:hypothetical protein